MKKLMIIGALIAGAAVATTAPSQAQYRHYGYGDRAVVTGGYYGPGYDSYAYAPGYAVEPGYESYAAEPYGSYAVEPGYGSYAWSPGHRWSREHSTNNFSISSQR